MYCICDGDWKKQNKSEQKYSPGSGLLPLGLSYVSPWLKGHGLALAFQMVQNFQDESCFVLSTLKGKAPASCFA